MLNIIYFILIYCNITLVIQYNNNKKTQDAKRNRKLYHTTYDSKNIFTIYRSIYNMIYIKLLQYMLAIALINKVDYCFNVRIQIVRLLYLRLMMH